MYSEIGSMPIFGSDKRGKGLNINTDKKNTYYVNTGTNALYQVLEVEDIKKVYVCSYNCYSVIMPFVNKNISFELFDVNKYFVVQNLYQKLEKETEKCAVLLQNFYATYYIQDIKEKLRERYKDIIIIEDITQSMLDDRTFTGADYYVGSVRKWAGTGEGGIICTNKNIDAFSKNDGDIINLYFEMAPMQIEYLTSRDFQLKCKYRDILKKINILLDEKYIQKINDYAMQQIETIDYEYIKVKRRENFEYLLNKLKTLDFISLPIKELNNQSVPLYLPIYVNNRNEFQKFLFDYQIYLPILWGIYDKIQNKINDETKYIYDHILCIHIDQRYNKFDMDRIFNAFLDYKKQL